MQKYSFSYNWFEKNIENWRKILLPRFRGEKINVLEIGVFEGASTTWILDNLLSPSGGTITCIDSYEGGVEHKTNKEFHKSLTNAEAQFLSNIQKTGYSDTVTFLKMSSFDGLIMLNAAGEKFDFIYVDGSHIARDVLSDAVLAWKMLKLGGVMIFDDYRWDKYEEDYNNPYIAINGFLSCFSPEMDLLHKSYQVILEKRENIGKITPKQQLKEE